MVFDQGTTATTTYLPTYYLQQQQHGIFASLLSPKVSTITLFLHRSLHALQRRNRERTSQGARDFGTDGELRPGQLRTGITVHCDAIFGCGNGQGDVGDVEKRDYSGLKKHVLTLHRDHQQHNGNASKKKLLSASTDLAQGIAWPLC